MKKIFLLFVLILMGMLNNIYSQVRKAEFKIHDRGNLWETMKDDGTIGAPNPTNRFETYPSMDWPGGPHKLNKDDQRSYLYAAGLWIGGKKSNGEIFFTENGPFSFVDQGTFQPIQEIENFVETSNFNPNEAEEKIISNFTTSENIKVERLSRSWSFPYINNFIILEYTITNLKSENINDVYIGFPYLIRPSYQDFIVHNGWGDDFNRTDDLVGYDSTRKLLYSFDDAPNFDLPMDVGNFWQAANELRTTGYAGFAFLHFDPAYDGRQQPSNILFAQLLNNENKLTLLSNTKENLYNILSGIDKSLQAEPEKRLTPFLLMSAGPYNLSPNSSIKIVIVEAVNGLPQSEAIKGLEAQEKLHYGLDSLKSTIDLANQIFQNDYKIQNVPPPSPNIEIFPLAKNQSIALSWLPLENEYLDPINNANDFLEYRIYRSDRSFIGPFQMIRRINPKRSTDVERFFDSKNNKWTYEDKSISLGAGYYYFVTSVDSSGNESGMTNRNEIAMQAVRGPAENALDVKVFPNPFKLVSGFPTQGTENYIVWTNLPANCNLKIYTSSGELVKTINHNNPNVGEEVWDQLTDARQRTAPGIYFWTVESSVGNAQGTLLIIK